MKFAKFFIGLLLFATPITFHVVSGNFFMTAPIGVVDLHGGTFEFSLHSGRWYTENGRNNFIADINNTADLDTALVMFEYDVGINPIGLTILGLMTTIILYGIALYLVLTMIDNEILNLISDLIMLGFMAISLVAFFDFNNIWGGPFDFGIPIFSILSGLLGLIGLISSAIKLSKK